MHRFPAPWSVPALASSGQEPVLAVVEQTGSTNEDLLTWLTGADGYLDPLAARSWPHLSALQAVHQLAGRGRLGRGWVTPPGQALLMSFVLRPLLAAEDLGWVPLVAGLAVRDALACLLDGSGRSCVTAGVRVGTKWPNDVVLLTAQDPGGPTGLVGADAAARLAGTDSPDGLAGDGLRHAVAGPQEPAWVPGWGRTRKVAGILTDLVMPAHACGGAADGSRPAERGQAPGVVVGIGVNVAQREGQLPVPWATSLRLAGWEGQVDQVRDAVGSHLAAAMAVLEAQAPLASQGGPGSALRQRLERSCTTLGQQVTVCTPDGLVRGEAIGVDPALLLRSGSGVVRVAAGDVGLVRAADRVA